FYNKEAPRSPPFTRLSSVMKVESRLIPLFHRVSLAVRRDFCSSLPASQGRTWERGPVKTQEMK
ncbi:hypothetical protein STEG23_014139, partial [Scotinomys teguina]